LALASLTGGDRSIGIVLLRTKTTEFFFSKLHQAGASIIYPQTLTVNFKGF
jgi:hypothetical protein